jgi:hypothetical protein
MFHCWAEILPNFHLKNMISTYTKDFASEKKMAQIRQIEKKKKSF